MLKKSYNFFSNILVRLLKYQIVGQQKIRDHTTFTKQLSTTFLSLLSKSRGIIEQQTLSR